MWPFKKREIKELHHYVKNSFQGVKKDTQALYQWIEHLQEKLHQQQQHITNLHKNSSTNHLRERLDQLAQKVDHLTNNHQHHAQKIDLVHQKIENLEQPQKHTFKEKIVQTFSRNSKHYLKNLIFNYLEQHQKLSALQLKDIIVDQQGLASKSTFYRILTEIENSDQVTVIKDGKQKVFLLNITPTNKTFKR